MDSQWRAAASGYAAQVLHPERSGPNAPLSCSSSLVPGQYSPFLLCCCLCSYCFLSLNGTSPWYCRILPHVLPGTADARTMSLFSQLWVFTCLGGDGLLSCSSHTFNICKYLQDSCTCCFLSHFSQSVLLFVFPIAMQMSCACYLVSVADSSSCTCDMLLP